MESDKYCRICLCTEKRLFSVYDNRTNVSLPHVIWNISGVKISRRLEPDVKVCGGCAKAVVAAEAIILRCQESEEYLGSLQLQTIDKTWKEESDIYEDVAPEENVAEEAAVETIKEEIKTVEEIKYKEKIVISTQIATDKHQESHFSTKQPRYLCDLCEFKPKTGKLLKAHKLEVHNIDDPRIYNCTLCTQRFSWKPTLYRHMQHVHKVLPEEKKFKCKECGRAYTREAHLTEHIKQRHQPRRFKCADPACEQTFTRAFTLRRHFLATHANTTRYHCADCDKYFKIYDLWKYHNEVVHKNGIVYCPRCGYPFRLKEKLEEHLQKDICKKSVIPCPYCQRRFTTKGGLREHLKHIHEISDMHSAVR